MIVKKVPTKKAAAPKSRGIHARDLCNYIAGPDAGHRAERIEERGAMNLLNIDHEAQVQEMADLAETATRSPQPVQHWILSWRQGEQPTAIQADQAVRIFLDEMGLGEHQAIYALHRNTDNYHLHVAVNRVHPDTERVITVNGGFDIEVAHRAIARIEHEQGWQREGRGRYRVLDEGEIRREAPDVRQREPTTRARDFENETGHKSAQRIAIEEAADVLRRAQDWQEVHRGLAEHGIRFEKKGSGAVLWVGDVAVKASTVGRDCSMSALQKRLGDLAPAHPGIEPAPRSLEPTAPDDPSWKAYAAEKEAHFAEKTHEREQLRKQQHDEWTAMIERQRDERQLALGGDWRGKGDALNAVRSLLAARQAQEKAAVRERNEMERVASRELFPRWPGYEEWLRERTGLEKAEEWRFRERTPAVILGDRDDLAQPRDIRAFVAEAHGAEVTYRRANTLAGPASFADWGQQILIHDLKRDSVLAALQLSAQKWGTFEVFGSDGYQRLCVELATEQGFRISNPELQEKIVSQREQLRQARHLERSQDVRMALTAARVHDVAEAYERHFEAVRDAAGSGRDDVSRLDAHVAVRLRVTGYDRDSVERAIRERAPQLRPDEHRNWNDYAKRAASHAFGLSGQAELKSLGKVRESLFRLEGRKGPDLALEMPSRRRLGLGI